MISRKELQYVSTHTKDVPFPGINYAAEVMENLRSAFKAYEQKYQDKSYNFMLSDGEEFTFEILAKKLAHLLGINYKNLISDFMEPVRIKEFGLKPGTQTSSFELLKIIIERADDIIKHDATSKSYKILNYYKIMIRCIAFSKLSTFETFDFGVINFDKEKYKETGSMFPGDSTKILFTPSDEAITPYFIMGLKKAEDGIYIPETVMAPENFCRYLFEQTLLLPIQVIISNNDELNKICATPVEKLNLLNMYKGLIDLYKTNSFIDIYADYESTLKENKKRPVVFH